MNIQLLPIFFLIAFLMKLWLRDLGGAVLVFGFALFSAGSVYLPHSSELSDDQVRNLMITGAAMWGLSFIAFGLMIRNRRPTRPKAQGKPEE
jgi:hypothetical protein